MITNISLYQFKNHSSFTTPLSQRVICTGRNGAGKSNLLGAMYLAINGILPRSSTIDSIFSRETTQGQVRLVIPTDIGDAEYTVSFDRSTRSLRLLYQWAKETRKAYLDRHRLRAVLFDPMEMNLLYLGPSLRRDFLDEILLIAHPEFLAIRRKYYQILRSRNALLKSISRWEASEKELPPWDLLFVNSILAYESYRAKIIAYFRSRMNEFESSIEFGSYAPKLALIYTNIPETTREALLERLAVLRSREIHAQHALMGPHLSDAMFLVSESQNIDRPTDFSYDWESWTPTDTYLSRGENKTLLLLMKFFSVAYIESISGTQVVLLLDDILSELDHAHSLALFRYCGDRQYICTTHHTPPSMEADKCIQKLHIDS